MKSISLLVSAVITAVLSTLCCLPAFLFLFFGVSAGSLSFLTQFDYLRVPFAILTFILLFLAYKKSKMKVSCTCTNKTKLVVTFLSLIMVFFVLLFYPEFSVYFID